jgi:hypothetical protein
MTKPKSEFRRGRRGHPGYDKLALYVRVEAARRLFGLSLKKACSLVTLTIADAGLPPSKWRRLTGETLRRHIQKFKAEHLANAQAPIHDAMEKLIHTEMDVIRI